MTPSLQRTPKIRCSVTRFKILIILVAAYLVKTFVMTMTPLSLELSEFLTRILIPHSMEAATPYGLFLRGIVSLWQMLPLDHPAVRDIWTTSTFHASFSAYLLVFLVKSPVLICDLLTGATVFWYLRLRKPEAAHLGLLLWVLNPYVLVFGEMWAPVDLLPTVMMFAAIVVFEAHDRVAPSVGAWILGIATKLFPLMILPAFVGVNNSRQRRIQMVVFLAGGIIGAALYTYWITAAGYQPWISLRGEGIVTQYFDEFYMSTIYVGTVYAEGTDRILGLSTISVILVSVFILEKWPRNVNALGDSALLILLVFFAFASWFPGFLLWMIPLMTVDIALKKRSIMYMFLILSTATFISTIGLYFYFTSNGAAFFFVPADSAFIRQVIQIYTNFAQDGLVTDLLGPIARTVFSITCLFYALKIIEDRTQCISALIRRIASTTY